MPSGEWDVDVDPDLDLDSRCERGAGEELRYVPPPSGQGRGAPVLLRGRRGGIGDGNGGRGCIVQARREGGDVDGDAAPEGEEEMGEMQTQTRTRTRTQTQTQVCGATARLRDSTDTRTAWADGHVISTSTPSSAFPSTSTSSTTSRMTANPPSHSSDPISNSTHPTTTTTLPLPQPFDPWNSASTGHQRSENRLAGSTAWRASRTLKLCEQYRGGLSGGEKRVADSVGAGSEGFGVDGRKVGGGWERGARGLRGGGQRSLVEVWGVRKGGLGKEGGKMVEREGVEVMKAVEVTKEEEEEEQGQETPDPKAEHGESHQQHHQQRISQPPPPRSISDSPTTTTTPTTPTTTTTTTTTNPPIFANLTFYLNASTAPHISDHKLRHLIAAHAGSVSLSLARRSVTHVVLSDACSARKASSSTTGAGVRGAGGSLAASKIQREIARRGGKGVRFVSVEWVLECVRRGRRVGEAAYAVRGLGVGGVRQVGVGGLFAAGKGRGMG